MMEHKHLVGKLLEFIGRHIASALVILILLFSLPLLLTHILFKTTAPSYYISAVWGAGDFLTYVAGFESLLGTLILGYVTLKQSKEFQKANERLSEESNTLQKIAIEKLYPILKVESIDVFNTSTSLACGTNTKRGTVSFGEHVSGNNRMPFIDVAIDCNSEEAVYCKKVHLILKNISESTISEIAVNKVEFSGFTYRESRIPRASCEVMNERKYIYRLIMPDDTVELELNVFFQNPIYKEFWEYFSIEKIGCFDFMLSVKNFSVGNIEYGENIYIEKSPNAKERISYPRFLS